MYKTRKYLKCAFIAALAFSLSACEDFLDKQPLDTIVEDSFYKTAQDMEKAMLAAYVPLQNLQWMGQGWRILEIPSDNTQAGGTDPDFTPIDDFSTSADNISVAEFWAIRYRAVALSNVVIFRAPLASISDEEVAALVGEAKFIRALAYFDLARVFGDVPISLEAPSLDNEVLLPRSPLAEVYALIEADLTEAAAVLPITRAGAEIGRATKGAALALHAKVELTLKNFRDAQELSAECMRLGVYSLMPNYGDNWNIATSDNNAESVFQIQHVGCGPFGTGNASQAFFAPFGQGITKGSDGWGSQIPTSPSVNNPGTTIQEAFEEGDLRLFHSIMEPAASYPNINPDEGGYNYPATGASRATINIKKYVIGGGPNTCFMSTGQNMHVIRYADVLLSFVEAAVELDGGVTVNQEALDAFNAIRSRAGLESLSIVTRDDLFQERRVEFAFECHRWFDLLRQGDVVNTMRLHGKTLDENKLLFPIPSAEIKINTELTQNEGY
jgi:hypothetical protein